MEYEVPQFIEVEDKIFGPLTLKQFIYLAGGAGVCVIVFLYLPLIAAILVAIPVGALAGSLAFYKINGKSFADVLEAGFGFFTGGRLYLWKKDETPTKAGSTNQTLPVVPEPRQKLTLTSNRLHDLAWELDIKNTPKPEKEPNE